MKNRYFLLTLFVLLPVYLQVFSQTLPFRQYTVKDGLPNANVHDIYQDKDGFIWFAVYGGISVFNGDKFVNYSTADGLKNNNIVRINESSDGILYFPNFRGGINYYKNGQFLEYNIQPQNPSYVSELISINDTMYIVHQSYTRLSFIHNNNITHLDSAFFKTHQMQAVYRYRAHGNTAGVLLICTNDGLYIPDNNNLSFKKYQPEFSEPSFSAASDKENNLYIGGKGRIYKETASGYEKVLTLTDFPDDIIYKLFVDSRGAIWFQPKEKGLYVYKNGRITDIGSAINLGNTELKKIYEDREGNVWISTSGKGVFCFYNFYIENYFEKDGLYSNNIWSLLVTEKGSKFIGTFAGLNYLEKVNIRKILTGNEKHTLATVSDIKAGLNGDYLICGFYNKPFFRGNYFGSSILFFSNVTACQFDSAVYMGLIVKNDADIILSYNNIVNDELISFKEKYVFKEHASVLGISEIEKSPDGVLWVGTSKGLCRIKNDSDTYFPDNPVLNSGISSLKLTGDNDLMAAGSKGICIIQNITGKLIPLQNNSRHDFRKTKCIVKDKDGFIWFGNAKGLYRIAYDSLINNRTENIMHLNEFTGLPSANVHALAYDKFANEMWVGTEEGLACIRLDEFQKGIHAPFDPVIESISNRDSIYKNFSGLVFSPSQNDLNVKFNPMNFSTPQNIKFEHRINSNDEWHTTDKPFLDFYSLPHGKYELQVRAVNNYNLRSGISVIEFEITAPFWKTIPFYILSSGIFAAAVLFIAYRRINNIKKKSQEKLDNEKNISELRHQTLSASMNPHFIFNSLNSIQHYMYMHNKEEANEYIVNFARLIRMNLDMANKTFISLQDELFRLELYLKYEKLRFGERLFYDINIQENINASLLMIPNMILQPFVENSIWHGLLPKQDKGSIEINIKREDVSIGKNTYSGIIIRITDDGIGLKEADKNRKSNHVSRGISIISDRLKLLASIKESYNFIKITDREDGVTGTLVTITLIPGHYKEHVQKSDKLF